MNFSHIRYYWAFVASILAVVAYGPNCAPLAPLATPLEDIGTKICLCSPSTYEFTFDFERPQGDNVMLRGKNIPSDAVLSSECFDIEGSEVDTVPLSVTVVGIYEHAQRDTCYIHHEHYKPKKPYQDGDTISYVSYTPTITSDTVDVYVPNV
jgi:hypothetical protein